VLNVQKATIAENGVVSEQCARELAKNVCSLMNADIGISFTGVAGPDELEGKPVGTVYIGLSIKNEPVQVEKLNFGGTREAIRVRSVKYACHFLIKRLKGSQNAE